MFAAACALVDSIRSGKYDAALTYLYGASQLEMQKERYISAVENFDATFGDGEGELKLFSAPGRTEIGGNHTDHNHGRVLAGSVDLDIIAVVRPAEGRVRVLSEGYPMENVELDSLEPCAEEKNTSRALIRGTAARFAQLGHQVGGFDAYLTSNVLKGSGLSSSAAYEVVFGVILNSLYNGETVDAVEVAQIAQYAENVYFGKPCGLLDQMASSVGSIITVDFADPANPVMEKVNLDLAREGYALCIQDVGGNHADLTDEYAAVPGEMKAVAASLGVSVLRETTMEKLLENIPALREAHGDRAVLRAIHFFEEDARVPRQVEALRSGDFEAFKKLIIASGNSSFEYLQNVYAACNVKEQGMSLALALAQRMLDGCGAWRVHGGGFGGTTQNFVPLSKLDEFKTTMEKVFGAGSCHVLSIRPVGGVCVDTLRVSE